MQGLREKDFFESIRHTVKTSYFISSIIPIALLVYVFTKYVFPHVRYEVQVNIEIILLLVVVLSVLGLIFSSKATDTSISSAQNLHVKLNSLIDITKQFRETLYLDILLEDIVKSAVRLNSAETASLLLYDETGNLKFKVLVGERSKTIKDRIVKRGEGISIWVAETGKSAIINDITKDERFNPEFDRETGFKTRSIMCVPLIHSKEVIGVIEVLNKKSGVFTGEDEKLLHSLADQAAISIAQSRIYESRHSDLIHITGILLSAQDYHSPEKVGHARRVANYVNLIARNMGLSEAELKNLYYASLFHDIGLLKIEISDPWKDDLWEKEKYIRHPYLGYEMIKPISLWSEAAEIILNHHERCDGTGYPLAKKGEEIPLGARILSVANTFDVLTSKYSYKNRVDYDAAINEIDTNSGAQFDPEVVKAFKTSIKDSDLISD